jgi:hypothetical protein
MISGIGISEIHNDSKPEKHSLSLSKSQISNKNSSKEQDDSNPFQKKNR